MVTPQHPQTPLPNFRTPRLLMRPVEAGDRAEFVRMTQPLVQKTLAACRNALRDAVDI